MARIRTVKPEFFRNHKLFQAEQDTGLPLRIAFAGLWTVADKAGRFKWEPIELKLDALPYDEVDFSRVLDALATRGYITHYASNGREYGVIPSWSRHQVINNRETESILPELVPGQEIIHASTTRQPRVTEITQGKGREGKGKEGNNSSTTTRQNVPAKPGAAVATQPADPLYRAIWDSFIGKAGKFTNYPKEAEGTKRLVRMFKDLGPDNPEGPAQEFLTKYWELTQGASAFWRKQPFTPSALSSAGIFDRVRLELMGADLSADWVDEVLPEVAN